MHLVGILGIATLALAVGGSAVALFAPLSSSETCVARSEVGSEAQLECTSNRSSIAEDEGAGLASTLALAVIVPAAAVAIGAQGAHVAARALLLAGALWLSGMTLLALLSVGIFIAPAALTGLAAAFLSLRRRAVDGAAV